MKGKQDHQAAAQEAFEEAGVKGKVHRRPLGAYTYEKRLSGHSEPIRVMFTDLMSPRSSATGRRRVSDADNG